MRKNLTKTFFRFYFLLVLFAFFYNSSEAQYVFSDDSLYKAGQENTGRLWGYAFGDFAYKGHADSLTRATPTSIREYPKTEMNLLSAGFTLVMIIT